MPAQITQKTVDRFIELVGAHHLSPHEAARAVKISERSGDNLMSANRERVEKLRSGDGDDPVAAVRAVVQAMLKGTPAERTKAAELYLRYPDAFNELPGDDVRDQLPKGTYIVYPSELFPDDPKLPPLADPKAQSEAERRREARRKLAERIISGEKIPELEPLLTDGPTPDA